MYNSEPQVKKIIQKFKETLVKHGIKSDKIILFGSHAQGTASLYSDIDLVVVSDDFAAMNFKQRCEVLGRAIADIMEPIEPLAYTKEEFNNLPPTNVISSLINNSSQHIIYL